MLGMLLMALEQLQAGLQEALQLGILGVRACDAQVILGHSRLAVTLEIYTHTDEEAQLDALTRLHDLFDEAGT